MVNHKIYIIEYYDRCGDGWRGDFKYETSYSKEEAIKDLIRLSENPDYSQIDVYEATPVDFTKSEDYQQAIAKKKEKEEAMRRQIEKEEKERNEREKQNRKRLFEELKKEFEGQ